MGAVADYFVIIGPARGLSDQHSTFAVCTCLSAENRTGTLLMKLRLTFILLAGIAGAFFWEPLENPFSGFRPKATRLGPGKVHPADEADKVEAAGLLPKSKDPTEQEIGRAHV